MVLLILFGVFIYKTIQKDYISVLKQDEKIYENDKKEYNFKYNSDWKVEEKDNFLISKENYNIVFEQLQYSEAGKVIKTTNKDTIDSMKEYYKSEIINAGWKYLNDSYDIKRSLIKFEFEAKDTEGTMNKIVIFIEKEKNKMLSFQYSAINKEKYNEYLTEIETILDSLEFN